MSKLIYTDVDECVVQWMPKFAEHGQTLGYKIVDPTSYSLDKYFQLPEGIDIREVVEAFNTSGIMKTLQPIDDSIPHLKNICEHFDYKIVFITACGDYANDTRAYNDRYENLEYIFGKNNIHDLHCVPESEYKRDHLLRYNDNGAIWVDDTIKNVEMGASLGYDSYLYNNLHNQHYNGSLPRIKSWEHIYNIIKKRETV